MPADKDSYGKLLDDSPTISTATVYDLSHVIKTDMPTYVGEPKPEFQPISTIENDKVNVSRIVFGSHTGTHVDAPKHFLPGTLGIDRVPLSTYIGKALVLDVSSATGRGVNSQDLEKAPLSASVEQGDILLLYTGTSDTWEKGDSAVTSFSFLDQSGADWIISRGIKCVGIDSFSMEKYGFEEGKSHKTLLGNGVGIVEGLSNVLKSLAGKKVFFVCLPLSLENLDGSPVRAVAFELDAS